MVPKNGQGSYLLRVGSLTDGPVTHDNQVNSCLKKTIPNVDWPVENLIEEKSKGLMVTGASRRNSEIF